MKIKNSPLFVVLISCITCSAQQRTKDDVIDIASHYLVGSPTIVEAHSQIVNPNLDRLSTTNDDAYYIVLDSIMNDFVIVSGDIRMKTVLGVGNFLAIEDTLPIPPGMQDLLNDYEYQYSMLQSGDIQLSDNSGVIDFTSYPDVSPLLTTKWGQESPYNDNCPTKTPSGCVATAMAQIMRYWKYPEHGTGSFSYVSSTNKYRRSFNYEKTTFDWENMLDTYMKTGDRNSSERSAVALLMEACGVSVGMDYTTKGSGAITSDIPYALIHFFNYGKSAKYNDRSYYKPDEWYAAILSDLIEGRPVEYSAVDPNSGGHAFILDGYDSKSQRFHFNWGWNGDGDGYFSLDALDPMAFSFSSRHRMVTRISPYLSDDDSDTFYALDFKCNSDIKIGKALTFSMSELACYASGTSYAVNNNDYETTIGIGLFDDKFNYITSLVEKTVKISALQYYNSYKIDGKLAADYLESNSTYYIAPFAKSKSASLPTRIRTLDGKTDYLVLKTDDLGDPDSPPIDEPDVPQGDIVWEEDFEDFEMPAGWTQDILSGNSQWIVRHIFFGSGTASSPNASTGTGYASLAYNSGSIFSNIRTLTRLQTDWHYNDNKDDLAFVLVFHLRKYASEINEEGELLSVKIDYGNNDWKTLGNIAVANMTQWIEVSIPFSPKSKYRLSFEGSLGFGSLLFIDNLKVCLSKTNQLDPVFSTPSSETMYYNLQGLPVKNHQLQSGSPQIIVGGDGRKIMIK